MIASALKWKLPSSMRSPTLISLKYGIALPRERRAAAKQNGEKLRHQHGAAFFTQLEPELDDAEIGLRFRRARLQHVNFHEHRCARTQRRLPAQLVDARRAETGAALEQTVGDHAHLDRGHVPARRRETTEQRFLRRLFVEMHRLRI